MKPQQFILLIATIFNTTICTAQEDSNKQFLLKAFAVLQQAVLNNNKEEVSSFFQFPVTDKQLKRKIVTAAQAKPVNQELNKTVFLKNYNRIFTTPIIDLFKNLDLAKLQRVSTIRTEMPPRTKTIWCSAIYKAVLRENEITITYATSYRTDMQLPTNAICKEMEEAWTFIMEGEKLIFRSSNKKTY